VAKKKSMRPRAYAMDVITAFIIASIQRAQKHVPAHIIMAIERGLSPIVVDTIGSIGNNAWIAGPRFRDTEQGVVLAPRKHNGMIRSKI